MNKKGMLWDYPSHMLQNGWGWAFWNSKPLPFSDKCGYLNKFEFINCAMTKYTTHQDARQENLNNVHIFWEGHKILQNLPLTFDCSIYSQKLGEDFARFCGLLWTYEL